MPQIDISVYLSIIQLSLVLFIFFVWFIYTTLFYSFFCHNVSLFKIIMNFFFIIYIIHLFNKMVLRYTDITFLHNY
jgi:hypothetical protein